MMELADAYEAGLNGVVPEFLREIWDKMDEEYSEYLRLKEKFEKK